MSTSEVARYGIAVNAICPGMIETDMVRDMTTQTNPDDPQSTLKEAGKG